MKTLSIPKKAWAFSVRSFGRNKREAEENAVYLNKNLKGKKLLAERHPNSRREKVTGFREYDVYYEFSLRE